MLDKTRTICGRNGRNSDFVQDIKLVTALKIRIYSQRISSATVLKRHFVHKYDGVSFGKLNFTGALFCSIFGHLNQFKKMAHLGIIESRNRINTSDEISPEISTPSTKSTRILDIITTPKTMLAGIFAFSDKQISLRCFLGIPTVVDFLLVLTQSFLNYFGFVFFHKFEKLIVKINICDWHGTDYWQRYYINI